jgi:hypothetical protein
MSSPLGNTHSSGWYGMREWGYMLAVTDIRCELMLGRKTEAYEHMDSRLKEG